MSVSYLNGSDLNNREEESMKNGTFRTSLSFVQLLLTEGRTTPRCLLGTSSNNILVDTLIATFSFQPKSLPLPFYSILGEDSPIK